MIRISDYTYDLRGDFIAQEPAKIRDSSRLFIYDTVYDSVTFDHFFNLDRYLPEDSFLVLNETKVLPSRVVLHKKPHSFAETSTGKGGKVKVLFLVNELEEKKDHVIVPLFFDRKVGVGDTLFFDNRETIEIIDQKEHLFKARFTGEKSHLFDILKQEGHMPIPLYIKKNPLPESQLRQKYQAIFAHQEGSSAAPTASLHFTNRVFSRLEKKGIPHCFITLHVGMGTFAPINQINIKEKRLHREWYEVPPQTVQLINQLTKEKKALVAVGTTVVRTLESFVSSNFQDPISKQISISNNQLPIINKTDLFIFPPYEFKMVDHLITNFHLPESSLMMLVDAFLQHKKAKRRLVELYQIAIKEKFRFYSFGDAMLIL